MILLQQQKIAKRMKKESFKVSRSSIYRYLKDKYGFREADESKVLTEDQKKLVSNGARDF